MSKNDPAFPVPQSVWHENRGDISAPTWTPLMGLTKREYKLIKYRTAAIPLFFDNIQSLDHDELVVQALKCERVAKAMLEVDDV